MAAAEDLLNIMRHQGAKDNPEGIKLAEMTGSRSCKVGELPLNAEDLYIPDRLLTSMATKVAGHCPADGSLVDRSSYSGALKTGDLVLICKLNDQKYAIIERVVSG